MSIFVEAVGAFTAAGWSADEARANIDAGMCRFRRSRYTGIQGAPHVVAPAIELSPAIKGTERGVLLLEPALGECLAKGRAAEGTLAVLLSLDAAPTSIPDARYAAIGRAARELSDQWAGMASAARELLLRRGLASVRLEVVSASSGTTAPFERASQLLEDGAVDRVLLLAVSSSCEPARLDWHAFLSKVAQPSSEPSFVGGEAGVALLLGRGPAGTAMRTTSTRPLGHSPPASNGSDHRRAEPLTEVVGQAVERAAWSLGVDVWIDLPDCRTAAREWTFASTRVFGARGIIPRVIRPAHLLGFLGAATLPLYVALASRPPSGPTLVVSVADASCRTTVSLAEAIS